MSVPDVPVRAIELRASEVLCYEDGHLLWAKRFPDRIRAESFYHGIVAAEKEGPTILLAVPRMFCPVTVS